MRNFLQIIDDADVVVTGYMN